MKQPTKESTNVVKQLCKVDGEQHSGHWLSKADRYHDATCMDPCGSCMSCATEGHAQGHLCSLIVRSCSAAFLAWSGLNTISGLTVDCFLVYFLLALSTGQVRNFVNKFILVLRLSISVINFEKVFKMICACFLMLLSVFCSEGPSNLLSCTWFGIRSLNIRIDSCHLSHCSFLIFFDKSGKRFDKYSGDNSSSLNLADWCMQPSWH